MKKEIFKRSGCKVIGEVRDGSKLISYNDTIYITHPDEPVKWVKNGKIEDVPWPNIVTQFQENLLRKK